MLLTGAKIIDASPDVKIRKVRLKEQRLLADSALSERPRRQGRRGVAVKAHEAWRPGHRGSSAPLRALDKP